MYPQPYVEFLERKGGESANLAKKMQSRARTLSRFTATGSISEHVGFLDAAGIDRQVISLPAQNALTEDVESCIDNARAANDAVADVCARFPVRLLQWAVLPLLDADASLRELDRARNELGAVGVTLPTHILGRPLDWEGMEPIYAALEAQGLPIFLHAAQPNHRVVAPGYSSYGIYSSVYFPAEDSSAVLRMVYSGVLERYPNLRVIVAHLGGVLPLWVGRAESLNDPGATETWDLPHPPSYYLRKIKYDTACSNPPGIRCACETFGLSQIVLGTDYPCEDMLDIMGTVNRVGFTESELAAVLEGNLSEWLPQRAATRVPALAG